MIGQKKLDNQNDLAENRKNNPSMTSFSNLDLDEGVLEKFLVTISERMENIENHLKKLENVLNVIAKKLGISSDREGTSNNESSVDMDEQFEPKFMKASDLLEEKVKNVKKSQLDSSAKIDLCHRLLQYLDARLKANAITMEEYVDYKNKISNKIHALKNDTRDD